MFNKIDLSTPCESIFLSTKSNKYKLFNKFLEKYKNIDNLELKIIKKQKLVFSMNSIIKK